MSIASWHHASSSILGLFLGHMCTSAYYNFVGEQIQYRIPAHELEEIVSDAVEKGQRDNCCSTCLDSSPSSKPAPRKSGDRGWSWSAGLSWFLWLALALGSSMFILGRLLGSAVCRSVGSIVGCFGSSISPASGPKAITDRLRDEARQQLAIIRDRRHGRGRPESLVEV